MCGSCLLSLPLFLLMTFPMPPFLPFSPLPATMGWLLLQADRWSFLSQEMREGTHACMTSHTSNAFACLLCLPFLPFVMETDRMHTTTASLLLALALLSGASPLGWTQGAAFSLGVRHGANPLVSSLRRGTLLQDFLLYHSFEKEHFTPPCLLDRHCLRQKPFYAFSSLLSPLSFHLCLYFCAFCCLPATPYPSLSVLRKERHTFQIPVVYAPIKSWAGKIACMARLREEGQTAQAYLPSTTAVTLWPGPTTG